MADRLYSPACSGTARMQLKVPGDKDKGYQQSLHRGVVRALNTLHGLGIYELHSRCVPVSIKGGPLSSLSPAKKLLE